VISRQWRGLARPDQADNYIEHLRSETFPALRRLAGFIDASILSRRLAEGVEFLIVTRWSSLAAIEEFAGSDPEAAVVPANVASMMLEYDRRARHFEVAERRRCAKAEVSSTGVTPVDCDLRSPIPARGVPRGTPNGQLLWPRPARPAGQHLAGRSTWNIGGSSTAGHLLSGTESSRTCLACVAWA
jgi:heme-degrading monooxygenase HmoA